jgi:hypothetical protein
MPEQRFWRMLEELPGQQAPLAVWRNRLGDWPLFDKILFKYLFVTGQRAASLACPTQCCKACPRRVVEYAPGDVEAICPEQEEPPIKITNSDMLFYGLKQSAIIKAVCDAIGIECKPSEPAGCKSSWRIGDFILPKGTNVPVYISIQESIDDLERVVRNVCLIHSNPIVLMAPTRDQLSAESEQILEIHKSLFWAMDEVLTFTERGNLHTFDPKGFLFWKLLPEELRITPSDPFPQNVFRQCGSRWQMRFEGGEVFPLDRQKGIDYLTALLASPHKPISVLDLYYKGTMDEQTRIAMSAGGLEVADDKYLKECRIQLGKLDRSINEAEQFNDPGQLARLHQDKSQLLKQIKGLICPGGKLRQSNDPIKRPRDAVSKAIRRSITNFRKAEMNRLADHLDKCLVFGKEMMYNPTDDICWEIRPITD